mgnify:CR=1 FL=1
MTDTGVEPGTSGEFGKNRVVCAPVGSTNPTTWFPGVSPGNVNCPDPFATTASSVAPGLAADDDSDKPHTPEIGAPVPVSVTVAVIDPRSLDITGSASVRLSSATLMVVGAPWNPVGCAPVGSTRYR